MLMDMVETRICMYVCMYYSSPCITENDTLRVLQYISMISIIKQIFLTTKIM